MKIKKFVAPSMPEAMKKVRSELGSDAVILNSKVVQKGGIFGFFTKKNIEVIAAVDPKPAKESQSLKKEMKKRLSPVTDGNGKQKDRILDEQRVTEYEKVPVQSTDILQEIKDLKSIMKDLSSGVSTSFEQYPGALKDINQYLIGQELQDSLRQELLSSLLERWYLNHANASYEEAFKWLEQILFQKISHFKFGGISYQRKFVNVVGPTGVGKTTTLAKIAAECVLKDNKKVAFITTDTYRIAAIDQLKTYAKILGVPIEVCYNMDDFRNAKQKFINYDLILIDTAGRNFRNKQYVEDLEGVIDFNEEMETFLVLALTSKLSDMKAIFNQFSLININRLIFTKVDETSNFGSMVNLMMEYNIGVAYVTNGQNVPDDIIEATPTGIIKTILGVEK